jgi:ADP-heptose:LPS heptosyltransferase
MPGLRSALLLRDFALLGGARLFAPKDRAPKKLEKVLVLGYAAIGDLLFLLPALRSLRSGLPGARIVFVSNHNPGSDELIPATGLVDEVWHCDHADFGKLGWRRGFAARVRAEGFDAVLVSQATPLRGFAAALLGIPLRVGHCRPLEAPHAGWSAPRYALWRLKRGLVSEEFERRLVLNRPIWVQEDVGHTVSRNLALLRPLGIEAREAAEPPAIPENAEQARFAAEALAEGGGLKTIAVHLGSPVSQYMKLWAPEQWAQVCRRAAEAYPCRIVLLGGADEAEARDRFRSVYTGPFVDLVGRTKLLEAFAVIKRCHLFMGNDTGLGKAAMALKVPTVTVWGPSDRPGYGAFWDRPLHAEVFLDLSCSPCVRMGLRAEGSGVINFSNCGHHNCLAQMAPERVFAALRAAQHQRLSQKS